MELGELNVPFIRQGGQVIHPNPIRDGLVLWYDFSGMDNSFSNKDIAEDLSGNGNHGTLQNFNYTAESGYDKTGLLSTGLKFDGVDDYVGYTEGRVAAKTLEVTAEIAEPITTYATLIGTFVGNGNGGFNIYNYGQYLRVHASSIDDNQLFTVSGLRAGTKLHIVAVMNGSQCLMYTNGIQIDSFDFLDYKAEQTNSASQGLFLGSYHNGSTYLSQESIFSAKAYNRPLTSEEIAHNYQIEKERFNIGGGQ